MAEKIYVKTEGLFDPQNTGDVINATADGAALWQTATAKPVPFVGENNWVFSLDGEMSVVDEGGMKPAADATMHKKTVTPHKCVYQFRTSDEFLKMSDEQKKPIMEQAFEGLVKKAHRALDIMAILGKDPASKADLSWKDTNSFVNCGLGEIGIFSEGVQTMDGAINEAIKDINSYGYDVNGVIFAPETLNLYGKQIGDSGFSFPEFAHGAVPPTFAGTDNVKKSILMNYGLDQLTNAVLLGDFNAFRWGYSDELELEVIETGDPDGQGDLKRTNEVCIRAEMYIGYSILDDTAFRLVYDYKEPEPSE